MQVIGMATIDRDLAQDGQALEVTLGDGLAGATVAPFPLYDTAKRRPRS
jgi:glycine cleavage system aminomethyltransferase T